MSFITYYDCINLNFLNRYVIASFQSIHTTNGGISPVYHLEENYGTVKSVSLRRISIQEQIQIGSLSHELRIKVVYCNICRAGQSYLSIKQADRVQETGSVRSRVLDRIAQPLFWPISFRKSRKLDTKFMKSVFNISGIN